MFLSERAENFFETGENSGNHHFVLFPTMLFDISLTNPSIQDKFDLQNASALNGKVLKCSNGVPNGII